MAQVPPKAAFLSTLMHLLEMVVCIGGSYLILHFFTVDDATTNVLVSLAVSGVAKFARTNEDVPHVPDYVNPEN